jgi:geranylgeranyl reductase family protein
VSADQGVSDLVGTAASPLQHPVAELAHRLFDAVIVGAGPAGVTAAIQLASAGHQVALVDKRVFPRSKVCGDGLIGDSIRMLRRLELYDLVRSHGHRLDAVRIFSPSQYAIDISGEFMTIRRDVLDFLLARAAVERGATFAVAEVANLAEESDCVVAQCRNTKVSVTGKLAIVATGADIRVVPPRARARANHRSATALRCYARSSMSLDRLIVTFDRSILPGYGWIFPLGNQEYNLGCGVFERSAGDHSSNLRNMFHTLVERFPPARELMARGALTSPLKGAPLRCGLTGVPAYAGGRIVAVGEATGTTFPFTGEGIGKAMETGALAADHVSQALTAGSLEPLSHLPRLLQTTLEPRYRGYQVAERWLSHAWLSDWLIKRASRSHYLQRAAAGVLNETVDPKEIFSWRGLVTSLAN